MSSASLTPRAHQLLTGIESWAHRGPVRAVVVRIGVTVVGPLVVLAGVAMLVLPGPGLVVMALGAALLALEYDWARRALTACGRLLDRAAARCSRRARPRAAVPSGWLPRWPRWSRRPGSPRRSRRSSGRRWSDGPSADGGAGYRLTQGPKVRRSGAQSAVPVVSSSNRTATRTFLGSSRQCRGIRSDTGRSAKMSARARIPRHRTNREGRSPKDGTRPSESSKPELARNETW